MISPDHFEQVCRVADEYDIHFTRVEFDIIRQHTSHRILPPHTIVMEQGKTTDTLYFLNSGIARLYRVHNDTDYTLGMTSFPFFLSTPLYIQSGQISTCAVESLTEIDVLIWDKPTILELKKQLPKLYNMELAVMDRLLTWLQDNQVNAICMTAEERYLHLLDTQPRIIQHVPLKYIASLLNIHQDSLSRIRKNIGKKS